VLLDPSHKSKRNMAARAIDNIFRPSHHRYRLLALCAANRLGLPRMYENRCAFRAFLSVLKLESLVAARAGDALRVRRVADRYAPSYHPVVWRVVNKAIGTGGTSLNRIFGGNINLSFATRANADPACKLMFDESITVGAIKVRGLRRGIAHVVRLKRNKTQKGKRVTIYFTIPDRTQHTCTLESSSLQARRNECSQCAIPTLSSVAGRRQNHRND